MLSHRSGYKTEWGDFIALNFNKAIRFKIKLNAFGSQSEVVLGGETSSRFPLALGFRRFAPVIQGTPFPAETCSMRNACALRASRFRNAFS
jgi:hypothetical protein